ncbi:cbb3-type cytochrome oxidase assembly protein CcoS [Rubinisphaera sp.]|mgnify:CR=1 FL=1|uniref:cbb3-type cytochrome oxidase assembly protein CcoS n=1 Tax=Rubinisphaera sp. TaxID=2024857 RepID=UPI000C0E2368|nr:cbb3-type cytochrome oxidase assembly protein CcoS [Rubinisphaera sp.]MBV12161.1 cbb3-type cytochrome oxidase assembly protein CcoS [Rubinisphaera sp.]HCS54304.1 cbb3-type cytochrome oxidase assembly protein CcoS [Planctomycetaceae bacterium]|tara:strand:- start:8030 stop:8209 length:180 start_codon:yes stop_codon:yes gene_type:complete
MSVIYVALPIALLLGTAAVIAFIWSVNNGQLDDLETPAIRMLRDDSRKATSEKHRKPGE